MVPSYLVDGGIIVVYVMCITWVSRYEVGPSTQKGQIAARALRISGGLPFLAMPLAVTSRGVSLALLSVLLIWLNLRFYPFGFRPISKGLKREVIEFGWDSGAVASLSCVFTQFSIAAVLLGCLIAESWRRAGYATVAHENSNMGDSVGGGVVSGPRI